MASEKILEGKKAKVAALTEMLQDSVSFVLLKTTPSCVRSCVKPAFTM